MHRPAPATVISLMALLFAMSGTAVAATGGDFLLGKANTATAVTSLTNTKGTALSLSSTSTTPPLTVSNSVQVPKLNASELGGVPASGYMQGGGTTTGARVALTGTAGDSFLVTPAAHLVGGCDLGGSDTGATVSLGGGNGTQNGATAVWWNKDGAADDTNFTSSTQVFLTPASTTPYVVVAQVNNMTSVTMFTISEWYDSGSDTCHFTAQAVTTNG